MRIILIIITALSSWIASASTIQVDCTDADIRAAIAAANEGDIIEILPGSATITNQISTPLGVSFWLRGSGTNQTFLTSGSFKYCFVLRPSENVFTVSDLNCTGSSGNNGGFFQDSTGISHFYNITLSTPYRGISLRRGLVEYCTFTNTGSSSQPINFNGATYSDLTNEVVPFGTTNAAYVENCYFNANGNPGNGYFDAYTGASLVFRYNLCDGYSPSGGHGYESSDSSLKSWEVYNNTWTNITNGSWVTFRGGSGLVYSNTVSGTDIAALQLKYYRSCPPAHLYSGGLPIPVGMPGMGFVVNYTNYDFGTSGLGTSFDGQPTNGALLSLGYTDYRYTNNTPVGGTSSTYGGGFVRIGATVAETITNTFNAVNLGPGAGTAYSASATIGWEFIAIGLTETDLILTNALDGNTDAFGYPANQQPGVLTSYPLTDTNFVNTQTLYPCYAWSNAVNEVLTGFTLLDNTVECNYYITNLVKLDRDYFNDVIPAAETYTPLQFPHPLSISYQAATPTTTFRLNRGKGQGRLNKK